MDAERPLCRLPGVDDTQTQCWRQFVDSSASLLAALNTRLLAAHRLSLFDVLLLDLLARSPSGSARMCEMTAALVMRPSRLSQQIGRLEHRGLVRRSPDPGDRRGVLATITTAGQARLERAIKTYAHQIRRHYLNPVSRQQMIALGDSCLKISTPPKHE